MNNHFYAPPMSPEEARQRLAMQQQQQQQQTGQGQGQPQGQSPDPGVGMMHPASLTPGLVGMASPLSPIDGLPMPGGDSLDDLVSQNTREFQRRASVPHPFSGALSPQDTGRRMSAIDFTASTPDAFPGFSYGFPTTAAFSQPGLMAMPGQSPFGALSPGAVGMEAFPGLDMGAMGADPASMGLFSAPDQYPPVTLDSVSPGFAMDMGDEHIPMAVSSVDPISRFAMGGGGDGMGTRESFDSTPVPQAAMGQFRPGMPSREPSAAVSFHSPQPLPPPPAPPSTTATTSTSRNLSQSTAGGRSSISTTASTVPATTAGPAPPASLARRGPQEFKKDVYSKTGFDMIRALFYVATRKNPTVEIGAVDMSCAFVVCDLTQNDCPIIYVSDNFQNLTGYNRHEIVGQNCRFLQSPDGHVTSGTRREFVANDAVYKLKTAVAEGREIQQSLINYRKGGKPFLNLLTMIPIPWDSSDPSFRYCIGFQIDLVECPDAISGQEPTTTPTATAAGGHVVNYCHSDIGQYIYAPPSSSHWLPSASSGGQTLSVDEVSTLIQHRANPQSPPSDWARQSWDKMLLENADDVVHVLSLKGLFLYLSPACKRVLEYDPAELVGTSLSEVCHPSDIVPVTRELKEVGVGGRVDVAFRIRRKERGYLWWESWGVLHADPPGAAAAAGAPGGKGVTGSGAGRKYLVLVGRRRPVLSLRRRDVLPDQPPGGEGEVWSKISTGGLFLYVSGAVRGLLDLAPRELEGTSMKDLMRKESQAEFGRAVEKARKGMVVGLRHEVLHKRGQLVPAQTVLYPGEAGKPSFLIAVTRLVKGGGAGRVIAGGKAAAAAAGGEEAMSGVVMSNPPLAPGTMAMTAASATAVTFREATSNPGAWGDDEDDEGGDIFAELRPTRCTSWQYELRQMEKVNRLLAEELTQLVANKKKRKRRKGGGAGFGAGGSGSAVRDCANCHKRDTPEWRRGPSGNRDLCNSCGLRWAKQVCAVFCLFTYLLIYLHLTPYQVTVASQLLTKHTNQTGKVSPRNSRANSTGEGSVALGAGAGAGTGKRGSVSTASTNSPVDSSPLRWELSADAASAAAAAAGVGDAGAGGSGMEMGPIREE